MSDNANKSSSTTQTKGGVPIGNSQNNENDSRVPLSAEPGVYKDDGMRRAPISAERGAYKHDDENSPKRGTAGDDGVDLENESKGPGSKV